MNGRLKIGRGWNKKNIIQLLNFQKHNITNYFGKVRDVWSERSLVNLNVSEYTTPVATLLDSMFEIVTVQLLIHEGMIITENRRLNLVTRYSNIFA